MKIAVFDTKSFDRQFLSEKLRSNGFEAQWYECRLNAETQSLAEGFEAICLFVNDKVSSATVEHLASKGLKAIVLRCAGYNGVDIEACKKYGVRVARVPAYSPHAVAEHGVALLLSLIRNIPRAVIRARDLNFSLDGLVGCTVHGKVCGLIGTGRIGQCIASIIQGFGAKIIASDPFPSEELKQNFNVEYVSLEILAAQSDFIFVQAPLTAETRHLVDQKFLSQCKKGAVLINVARGGLIDSKALIESLKNKHLGGAGLDVYEEEENYFFRDFSGLGVDDDLLARLLTFPNVLITSHQAFLTKEALETIAETSLSHLIHFRDDTQIDKQYLVT